MARLIVKSPYIKCNGSQSATGYMKYIATRERVEILPDDRPPTRKQEQLITKLSKDFPGVKELLEYEDYTQHPTKANASALITLALEENWSKVSTSEGYAKYIATRPRAQRLGDHGLFGDEDRGMEDRGGWVEDQELTWDCYELRSIIENEEQTREDRVAAAVQMKRLAQAGDAHAQYLMGVLYRDGTLVIPDTERAQYWVEEAATQNVPAAQYALGKLLLSDDPLVHDPDQGIRWLKAAAQNGNDYAAYALGKEYLSGRYVFKNTEKAADYLHQAAQEDNPWAQYLLGKLYLMGDGVEQDEEAAYQWFQAAAEQGHIYAEFFVERMEQGWTASPQLMLSTTRLLHHMGNIFRDNTPAPPASGGPHIDRKRLQKLRAKKIAQGHKPDDHEEEQQSWGMNMGGW